MFYIPFELKYIPIKKLALINFEKNPDSVYNALELQYLDGEMYGTGYRVVAYRCDGYIDVYDDPSLNEIANEDFNVAGKGLGEKAKVSINKAVFHVEGGNVHISFNFTDKKGRDISVKILERSGKVTKNLSLLAPIGHSSENPSCLPLYFLYEFDFIRKSKTLIEITIDGKKVRPDNFPVPIAKDFQRRYYARYATNCQIVEFTNCNDVLPEFHLGPKNSIIHNSTEYFYESGRLQKMLLRDSSFPTFVEFEKGVPEPRSLTDGESYQDTFTIGAAKSVGVIRGKYCLERTKDIVLFELCPSEGWAPMASSLLTKMMFAKDSVFCTWPKTYRYIQKINIKTSESICLWERG